MLSVTTLQKAMARVQPAIVSRALATNACRLTALARANSAVIEQTIDVLDTLINENGIAGANEIFQKECPIVSSTVGKQFRHTYDHLEKVALDGLRAVGEDHKPIDLHYDVRERGGMYEHDVSQARQRAVFIKDYFDTLIRQSEKEGQDACSTDSRRPLTAYFTLPTGSENVAEEIPLSSTLERELGFTCHHAIHHCALIKAIANAEKTGLLPKHLPPDFGQAPTTFVSVVEDDHRAA
jgi:hypothetical protein